MESLRRYYTPKSVPMIEVQYVKTLNLPSIPALSERDVTVQVEVPPNIIFQHTPSFSYYPQHSNIDTDQL